MKKVKILSMIVWFAAILSWVSAFNTNFYFTPASGTDIKLYCKTPIYFMINWWTDKSNWFSASIKFDPTNIQIIPWTIHSDFPNWSNVIVWNLYNVWWAMKWWSKQWTITWVTFHINTKNNIYSTTLSFVGSDGTDPTYWLDTTDDGISLNGFDESSRDILTSVTNTTYNFVALPCVADNKNPTITSVSVNDWATKIASNKVITFVTYDWDGSTSNKMTHWFAWNSTWNLSNYVDAPDNVDNQEWVNSWSISVKVSCSTCSGSPSNVPATLTISDWNWSSTMNALTWDSERRWYNVSINPPFPYEVEKKVTVNISVSDNPNENWQTHTQTKSISFNTPVAPTISRISPATDTFVSPSKNFPISFYISDAWAGVDTSSVAINVSYSGEEFIYSWSDLDFELSWWSEWLWNAWSYRVTFYPKEDFPVLTQINIHVTWADLAGNVKTFQSSFTTRPDCSFFGCIDSVTIIWDNINQIFSWTVLSITWTNPNSPYPYLTWENKEILMCGKDWSGTDILGNVYLYDAWWNRLNNVQYTWNDLFITWLDVIYQDGIIIVE